jgi:hypothetical protein
VRDGFAGLLTAQEDSPNPEIFVRLVITEETVKTHVSRMLTKLIEDDGIYLAVASAGGALKNPSWYASLIAHPDVLVQDRGR